ncbi:MAG: hypothetical protein ONB48_08950 [candidate division KSB1 bacterium]|nr:hypothetical protein [candidate division KSB1 bacterium]MDZ7275944.1 hypothetical protein [candidate division KSB1 bacterium]MDZ7285774.1 hypothetical protein [candidate division KSB1 bacterium]MDZ7298806.1 hypothetical protein [candidate division KSB1 bacterium]MDZ7308848.1 hypothetical protein [candidate division KSB1 bacterium]
MMLVEYLVWILVVCYGYFVVLRLFWLYREQDQHIVWKRADAGLYYGLALLNFLTMLSLYLLKSRPVYLLVLLIGTYVFCAAPVVKVNTRGIMMNALLTHWSSVVAIRQLGGGRNYAIITRRRWPRWRLCVPGDMEGKWRKMVASKGLRILAEDETTSSLELPGVNSNEMKFS